MAHREEDRSSAYWNRKWKLRERSLHEEVFLDGSDGESEFDRELLKRVRGKDVLDIGCGPGEFTLRVSKLAKSVAGVDSAAVALAMARRNLERSGLRNVELRLGEAGGLPFRTGTFDLAYSRRGPASDSKKTLAEALRCLRNGGTFTEITIGERDKRNIAEIFGRGQKLGFRGQVSAVKKKWLEEVGFREATARDYVGTEVFRTMADLVVRLRTAPIIPAFDAKKDKRLLERVSTECTTERGVETPVHRVVLVARK